MELPETDFGTSASSRKSAPTRFSPNHPEMFPSPNDKNNVMALALALESSTPASSSSSVSVWSSPNIGQMTEMSQEWYRKMMTDGAELVKISLEPQYKDIDFSAFITQSQPPPQMETNAPQTSFDDDAIFPFNSLPLPDGTSLDYSFLGGALLTPIPSSRGQNTCPDSSIPNTMVPSPRKKHSISSRGHVSRGRKYHNTNALAQHCQEVLFKTAHPSLAQISEIVSKLHYPSGPSEKKLKSLVREWFRKRREYMATKIYRSCQSLLPPCPIGSRDEKEMSEFIQSIHSNRSLIGIIMLESKLPMESEVEKIDFVNEKIVDFYLKYPQRKLRNCTGFKNCQGPADFDLFVNQNYQ